MDVPPVARLKSRWGELRYGFLFFPGLVAVGFVALAFLVVRIDRLGGTHGLGVGFGGDASAARTVLSTIASSLITVAGLTFSITIVSLQLVSQQFTPRALRNFLGDGLNQAVAGCFVGIFAYCLLVLRTIRDGSDTSRAFDGFVPALAVSLAIVLGIFTLGLLLVFIHHMSRSIQVSTIASRIGRATLEAVDDLYPDEVGQAAEDHAEELLREWRREAAPVVVWPNRPGYVQAMALDEIRASGEDEHLKVHVRVAPGDFVTPVTPVAEAWPPSGDAASARDTLSALITVENERDLGQDVLYGIRQLTDIAVRALSPSTNDPTTAITCLGYTQAVLERLAGRALPSRVRRVDSVEIVARRREFDDFAAVGLAEVAHHARGEPRVVAALLQCAESVERCARAAGAHDRASVLRNVTAALGESVEPTSADARRTSAPAASGALPR